MRARSPHALLLSFALAGAMAIGCSSGNTNDAGVDGGPSCVAAPSCPDAGAPSYATEIAPIIQEACVPCHGPGGSAGFYENTYAAVHAQYGNMLEFTNSCEMPPLNGPQLSDAQRVALTAWLRCGAPDN